MPHSQMVAYDFTTSIGLNIKDLQYVEDDIYVVSNGDTNISIYVEKDDSVYLTIYKAEDFSIIDRAFFRKKNDSWEEIDDN